MLNAVIKQVPITGTLTYVLVLTAQAQLISDALDLGFDGLRTNIKEHMVKVPEDSHPASAPA